MRDWTNDYITQLSEPAACDSQKPGLSDTLKGATSVAQSAFPLPNLFPQTYWFIGVSIQAVLAKTE